MHIYLHFIITYNIKLLKVVTDELRWLCSSLAHTSGIQFTTECQLLNLKNKSFFE